MIRIGQGFDLHRLKPGRPFALGGIILDWPKGPQGHSDSDVVLHALIDALLGATSLGDIGEWFPPSDDQWKGADSAQMLNKVTATLLQKGVQLINVDSTIFLEAPKLSPYKPKIQARIAKLLNLPLESVSIKAKTMEGLGPIGHQEAVACQVIALVDMPEDVGKC